MSTERTVLDAHVCQLSTDLASAGICASSNAARLKLARTVLEQDAGEQRICPADLDALLRRARAEKARSPVGLVTHWLKTNTWREQLTAPKKRLDGPSVPDEFKEQVETHAIISVALMDRKPADVVAKLYGVTADRVRELVDTAGRHTYGDKVADLWLGRAKLPKFKKTGRRESGSGRLPTPRELGLR
jgi:hypothetical protein